MNNYVLSMHIYSINDDIYMHMHACIIIIIIACRNFRGCTFSLFGSRSLQKKCLRLYKIRVSMPHLPIAVAVRGSFSFSH